MSSYARPAQAGGLASGVGSAAPLKYRQLSPTWIGSGSTGVPSQIPVDLLHSSPAGQFSVPLLQTPATQTSPTVHAIPSSQVRPSLIACVTQRLLVHAPAEHAPLSAEQSETWVQEIVFGAFGVGGMATKPSTPSGNRPVAMSEVCIVKVNVSIGAMPLASVSYSPRSSPARRMLKFVCRGPCAGCESHQNRTKPRAGAITPSGIRNRAGESRSSVRNIPDMSTGSRVGL